MLSIFLSSHRSFLYILNTVFLVDIKCHKYVFFSFCHLLTPKFLSFNWKILNFGVFKSIDLLPCGLFEVLFRNCFPSIMSQQYSTFYFSYFDVYLTHLDLSTSWRKVMLGGNPALFFLCSSFSTLLLNNIFFDLWCYFTT